MEDKVTIKQLNYSYLALALILSSTFRKWPNPFASTSVINF